MASLIVYNVSKTNASFVVGGLNDTVRYREITVRVDGKTSPNLAESFMTTDSKAWGVSTLSCGRTYTASVYIESMGGSKRTEYATFDTSSCSVNVGSIPFGSWSQGTGSWSNQLTVNWGWADNATNYDVTLYHSNGSIYTYQTTTSNAHTFYNVPYGNYYARVTGTRYGSPDGPTFTISGIVNKNPLPAPDKPSWASLFASVSTTGEASMNWATVSNVSHYSYNLYTTGGSYVTGGTTTRNTASFSGLPVNQCYYATVTADNSSGQSLGIATNSICLEVILTTPGSPGYANATPSNQDAGKLTVDWGASARANDYLITLYTAAGGWVENLATYDRSIIFRGLTQGSRYYAIVVPRNGYGNGPSVTTTTITMPTIMIRPTNWQWDSVKTSGNNLNLTASEWNRFLNKIDAFRKDYKGLPGGSYSYASQGSRITASQYNQARLAISSMGAVPPAVSTGNRIYAYEVNNIRDYLNAIT